MGTHFGATPKQIADDIAKASDKAYTTYVKNGIKRYVWTYTSTGTFKTPNYNPSCDILTVGAGGGGGGYGGGGGGGAVLHSVAKILPAGTYSIIIGAGAVGKQCGSAGTFTGESTTAFSQTATGGGTGGRYNNINGSDGANGGGAGAYGDQTNEEGAGVVPDTDGYTTAYCGFDGGDCVTDVSPYPLGGGGGAGAVGGLGAAPGSGGVGGAGKQVNIDGNNYYWAGGGGGGVYAAAGTGGVGGVGGGGGGTRAAGGAGLNNGGAGSNGTTPGANGGANTGGGGGGNEYISGTGVGGTGGSGIVVIKFPAG
jgi:hypothetical protein